MISYSLPFPPISWYLCARQQSQSSKVSIDIVDRFQKRSYRNRYYIAGAQGIMMLSIPLAKGRSQRVPMFEVKIDNTTSWQKIHWRTLITNYKRAPYFEDIAPFFQFLFEDTFEYLHEFNTASLLAIQKLLKLPTHIDVVKELPPSLEGIDIRNTLQPRRVLEGIALRPYHQVFIDKCGFIEDLSIIDYMFNEGIHL